MKANTFQHFRRRIAARRRHSLTNAEFDALTPAELALLDRDHHREQRAHDYRHAEILATLYNTAAVPPKRPLTAADFLPKKQPTPEQLAHKIAAAFGVSLGTPNNH